MMTLENMPKIKLCARASSYDVTHNGNKYWVMYTIRADGKEKMKIYRRNPTSTQLTAVEDKDLESQFGELIDRYNQQ